MTSRFLRVAATFALGIAGVAGCREQLAPSTLTVPSQLRASLSKASRQNVLLRTTPLHSSVAAAATIGSAGGVLRLDAAGLTLTVPEGAVPNDVQFSVTARAGRMVRYEFEPHGTSFAVPLTLTQDLTSTQAAKNAFDAQTLQGGYVASSASVNESDATADVSELLPVTVDAAMHTASFPLAHFSGYILATGKADTTAHK